MSTNRDDNTSDGNPNGIVHLTSRDSALQTPVSYTYVSATPLTTTCVIEGVGKGKGPWSGAAPLQEDAMTEDAAQEKEWPVLNERDRQLGWLREAAKHINRVFFHGRLDSPNLAIGPCSPQRLAECAFSREYPGELEFTLNEGLVFGTNRDWIVLPLPDGEGVWRFLYDLILRFSVRQYVLENMGIDESNAGGFGPHFIVVANRIGKEEGLRKVGPRKRKMGGPPAASGWPHCVRPLGYYDPDVRAAAVELACGGPPASETAAKTPNEGLLQLLQYLMRAGRMDDARQLVDRHLDWATTAHSNWPRKRRVESGAEDEDGLPLGKVHFRRKWLAWNGWTVRRIAESIRQCESYAELPLLADALEEAGCKDYRILDHLRAKLRHGGDCWVLRGLLGVDAE